nr:MAG: hypothetical protein J07AB56_12490 [Candidatus Nanosalinarum sp. J07AB56]
MVPIALETELGGCDIHLYGHEHTAENLEEEMPAIRELLEDSDLLVFEPLGFQRDTPEMGDTPGWSSTGDGYVGGVMDVAGETLDTAYGLDSKNIEFGYAAGLIAPALATGSLAVKKSVEALRDSNTAEIDRRDFLLGSGGVASYGLFGGFDSLLPEQLSFLGRELDVPEAPSQSDAREVYIAEGMDSLARNKEYGSILGIFGREHVQNIEEYLEQPESRAERFSFYSDLIPEDSKKYTRFENANGDWHLSEVGNVADI